MMAMIPASAFRSLLSASTQEDFMDFVADLWRAREYEVRQEESYFIVEDRKILPVLDVNGRSVPEGSVLVSAREPPRNSDSSVIGPGELHRMLLYDVPREAASELLARHFGRPLYDDWTDRVAQTTEEEFISKSGIPVKSQRWKLPLQLCRNLLSLRRGDGHGELASPWKLVAILVVIVTIATSGLLLYQPESVTTDPPPFADINQQVPTDGSYRVHSQVRVTSTGEHRYIERGYTYAPSEPPIVVSTWSIGEGDDRMTRVTYTLGNYSYTRYTFIDSSKYRAIRDTHERTRSYVRSYDATKAFYKTTQNSNESDQGSNNGDLTPALSGLAFERQGEDTYSGRRVVRFVPTTGWVTPATERNQTIYIRNATGEMLVDAQTDALMAADVEVTVVDAETWAGVYTKPTRTLDIQYRVVFDVKPPRTPPWVDGLRANMTAEDTSE